MICQLNAFDMNLQVWFASAGLEFNPLQIVSSEVSTDAVISSKTGRNISLVASLTLFQTTAVKFSRVVGLSTIQRAFKCPHLLRKKYKRELACLLEFKHLNYSFETAAVHILPRRHKGSLSPSTFVYAENSSI